MKVENNTFVQSLISTKLNTEAKGDEFEANLERELIKNLKSQQPEEEGEDTNKAVEEFRQNLTSLGAAAFFQQFNMEKIEKKLEEKRQELEASLGLDENANPPLSGEERTNALKALDEMLNAYAKELKEQMQAMKEFDKEENPNTLSSLLSSL